MRLDWTKSWTKPLLLLYVSEKSQRVRMAKEILTRRRSETMRWHSSKIWSRKGGSLWSAIAAKKQMTKSLAATKSKAQSEAQQTRGSQRRRVRGSSNQRRGILASAFHKLGMDGARRDSEASAGSSGLDVLSRVAYYTAK